MPGIDKYADNETGEGQNKEWTVPTASDVTIECEDSGTDTDTTKYLNIGRYGQGFVIRPSNNAISIVSIDARTYIDPISIPPGGTYQRRQIQPFKQIVLRTTNENKFIRLEIV